MDTRLVVRVGPLVFSKNLGGGQQQEKVLRHPAPMEQVLAELSAAGWKVTGRDSRTALVSKGWTALQIDSVPGGVVARKVTSRPNAILTGVLLLGLIVGFLACLSQLS